MSFEIIETIFGVLGAGCFVCAMWVLIYCALVELRERKREPGWTQAEIDAMCARSQRRQIDEHFSRMEAE